MKISLSLLVAMLCISPLAAQKIDPDWCLTCIDSRQHALAGAGIETASLIVLPKSKPWQRILITTVIGTAYELGQTEGDRSGRGYGFGPKDLLLDVFGGLVVEGLNALL